MLQAANNDAWALPGVSSQGFDIWWHLDHYGPQTTACLASALGLDRRTLLRQLHVLDDYGLARSAGSETWRSGSVDAVAGLEGPHVGVITGRGLRYRIESLQWAQWCADRAWKSTPYKHRKRLSRELRLLRRFRVLLVPGAERTQVTVTPRAVLSHGGPDPTFDELLNTARTWRTNLEYAPHKLSDMERQAVASQTRDDENSLVAA